MDSTTVMNCANNTDPVEVRTVYELYAIEEVSASSDEDVMFLEHTDGTWRQRYRWVADSNASDSDDDILLQDADGEWNWIARREYIARR